MRRSTRWSVAAGLAGLFMLRAAASATALTYSYSFDAHPGGKHFDWDDVSGPHSYLHALMTWEVDDTGGVGGSGAMRVTPYDEDADYIYQDYRAIQINAEPGTTVRIQFDVRVAAQDAGGMIRVRHYDGYCGALSFYNADSLGSGYPASFFEHTSGTDDTWQHVDFTTAPLANSVLTLCFHFEDLSQPVGSGPTGDYFIDNLELAFVPQSQVRDPFMNWDANYGSTFNEWRLNGNGAHVAWCDWMEERDYFFDGYCEKVDVDFDYESRYDTTSRPIEIFVKQDLDHKEIPPWGSIFRIDNVHDAGRPKIYGIRQTASYDSILPGGQLGTCTLLAEAATLDDFEQKILRFWIGVDPYGGREPKEEDYPNTTGCFNPTNVIWDNQYMIGYMRNLAVPGKTWKLMEIEWERPPDAEAFTVYFKAMDWHHQSNTSSDHADFLVNAAVLSAVPSSDPAIATSVSRIDEFICYGESLPDGSFTIRNGGLGTINYTITDDATWLSVSPDSGDSSVEEDTIAVLYEEAGLPPGYYTATITITSPEATNSPRTIPVTLTVETTTADFDLDGDVDHDDFSFFQECYTGTGGSVTPECVAADFNGDDDADQDDLVTFETCASGPDVPIDPACCGL